MSDSSEVKRGVENLVREIQEFIGKLPADESSLRALAYSLLHLAESVRDLH